MKAEQLDLIPKKVYRKGSKAYFVSEKLVFGGALNYRKMKRPFDNGKSVHVILRSRLLSGSRSLLRGNRRAWVNELLLRKAKKYNARLYKFSINSNHLHLLIRFKSEQSQIHFLRDFSGTMALKIKRTFKISKSIKIWDARPFSRLVGWGKSFQTVLSYINKNRNEALGLWPFETRKASHFEKSLELFSQKCQTG